MTISKLSSFLTPNRAHNIQTIATWTCPALFIPSIRYQFDDPKNRKELFIRDSISYAVSASILLGTMATMNYAFKKIPGLNMKDHTRKLAAFFVAMACYILYSGIGVVKWSKRIVKSMNDKKEDSKIDQTPVNNTSTQKNTFNANTVTSPFMISKINGGLNLNKTSIFKQFEA